jgi:mono/diheme cytochrome c family protein
MGPAQPFLYPPPLNFTLLNGRGISGGILYYQIMNGITGTAMPFFKKDLESEKIWDVGDYVAVFFIGQTDADTPPKGIDASNEPFPPRSLADVLDELEPPVGRPLEDRKFRR